MAGPNLIAVLRTKRVSCALVVRVALVPVTVLDTAGATLIVSNTNDSGAGSLRQAILDANAASGRDTIVFQIPGSGAHTLTPLSALPPITDPIAIDGTTQPGFTLQPVIELNGASAGNNAGLRLLAGNSTIRGLVINRFGADGIRIEGPGTNFIQGNFIGTDVTGSVSRGNGQNGVLVNGSSGNVIGGTNTAGRNVISANGDTGVYLLNGGGNVVQGNFIGTTVAGTTDLGNTNNGIAVYNASGNLIGGTIPATRNILSGNDGSGIYLFGTGATANLVQGNYIGTDGSGSLAIGNVADGVTLLDAASNTIGGTNAGAGNVIAGNGKAGVFLNGAGVTNNLVQGNLIGTDASGRLALGNAFAGITISGASGNRLGGTTAEARNVISGNKQDGVFITTNSVGNLLEGNFIGVDATGTNAVGNLFNGVSISSAGSNVVGGSASGARNLVSGNANYGIQILNSGATANLIQGNYVGPNVTGRSALGNRLSGLRIESMGNIVGGTGSGTRNLISGNGQDGISLVGATAMGNVVRGNYIGTDVDGNKRLSNSRAGVGISDAAGNAIGGTTAGAGNLISANGDAGIYLVGSGATGNQLQGNTIGADVTGTLALGNVLEGIYAERAPANTIGGTVPGAGNLISANNTRGIWLTNASWNVIQGNLIGTKIEGVTGLGNVFHAVELEAGANNNTIGGTGGAGNRIAFSKTIYAGVRIRDGSTNNLVRGNAIFSNGALGIDLGAFGVTANDPCDTDTGANMLQNFPALTQAVSANGTGIRGTLEGASGGVFRLEFFANSACDSGRRDGQIYLGEKTVVTGNNCNTGFVAFLSMPVPAGYFVTATATDQANNTSEFSACVPVMPVPALTVIPTIAHQVDLAWSNTVTGLALKQTDNLALPIQWNSVTNRPVLINGQWVVSLAVAPGNRFFVLSFE